MWQSKKKALSLEALSLEELMNIQQMRDLDALFLTAAAQG
jgi:hypothetical protein